MSDHDQDHGEYDHDEDEWEDLEARPAQPPPVPPRPCVSPGAVSPGALRQRPPPCPETRVDVDVEVELDTLNQQDEFEACESCALLQSRERRRFVKYLLAVHCALFGPKPTVYDLRRIQFYAGLYTELFQSGGERTQLERQALEQKFNEFLFCAVSDIYNRNPARRFVSPAAVTPGRLVRVDSEGFSGLQHLASPSQVFCQRVRNLWDKVLDVLVSALP
jgi:hypothetical protein